MACPFDPPNGTYQKEKIWINTAKPGFRNPKRVWNEYWKRFNTITIPLLDEDAYFADAIAAAKRAQDRDHLEELLAEKFEERRQDLTNLLTDIFLAARCDRKNFPSQAVCNAARKVGETGSLDSFLQFVCGVAFNWKEFVGQAHIDAAKEDNDHVNDGDGIRSPRHDFPDDSWSEFGEQSIWDPPLWYESSEWNDDAAYHNKKLLRVTECDDENDEAPQDRQLLPSPAEDRDRASATDGRGRGKRKGKEKTRQEKISEPEGPREEEGEETRTAAIPEQPLGSSCGRLGTGRDSNTNHMNLDPTTSSLPHIIEPSEQGTLQAAGHEFGQGAGSGNNHIPASNVTKVNGPSKRTRSFHQDSDGEDKGQKRRKPG
ncbi:hypothetical protein ACRALDRAFT_1062274 [Sodiomyces alcalophilus JCM 7366]|uniref:uncharacterized protein n=1 Tax=Sodiomyces alcalophilus JCM 7366 TaxID=591952 RepID=UPI0039B60263